MTRQRGPWFGVRLVSVPEGFRGGTRAVAKALDDANSEPEIVFSSRDRDEARAHAREWNLRDDAAGFAEVVELPYDPRAFTVRRQFQPDAEAMRRLLRVDLGGGR